MSQSYKDRQAHAERLRKQLADPLNEIPGMLHRLGTYVVRAADEERKAWEAVHSARAEGADLAVIASMLGVTPQAVSARLKIREQA